MGTCFYPTNKLLSVSNYYSSIFHFPVGTPPPYLFRLCTPYSPVFPIQTHFFFVLNIRSLYFYSNTPSSSISIRTPLCPLSYLHIFPSELIFLPLSYSKHLLLHFFLFELPFPSFTFLSKFLFLLFSCSNAFSFLFLFELPLRPSFLFQTPVSSHFPVRILFSYFFKLPLFPYRTSLSSQFLFKHILFSNFPIRTPTSAFSLSELLFLQLSYSNTHIFIFFIRTTSSPTFTIRTPISLIFLFISCSNWQFAHSSNTNSSFFSFPNQIPTSSQFPIRTPPSPSFPNLTPLSSPFLFKYLCLRIILYLNSSSALFFGPNYSFFFPNQISPFPIRTPFFFPFPFKLILVRLFLFELILCSLCLSEHFSSPFLFKHILLDFSYSKSPFAFFPYPNTFSSLFPYPSSPFALFPYPNSPFALFSYLKSTILPFLIETPHNFSIVIILSPFFSIRTLLSYPFLFKHFLLCIFLFELLLRAFSLTEHTPLSSYFSIRHLHTPRLRLLFLSFFFPFLICIPPSHHCLLSPFLYPIRTPHTIPLPLLALSFPIPIQPPSHLFFPIRTPPPSVTFFKLSLLPLFRSDLLFSTISFRSSPPSPFLLISLILWFTSFPVPLSFFFLHHVFFSVLISSRLSKVFFLSFPFRSYSFYSSS
ncbi:unnamed protein product [Acanthosepion pharaonis]|uniref:Uncharacterized protein n=1 Tax=Acanthosepion pharaonis TaxID=158019 RepID=A0A812DVL8_ACAPH|nr:unnamed protein product [Sepia pharaonis]